MSSVEVLTPGTPPAGRAAPSDDSAPIPRRRGQDALWRLGLVLAVVALWIAAAQASELVPPIGATLAELADGFTSGWIYDHLVPTTRAVLTGFLVAAAVGFPTGYVLGRSRFLGAVFEPLVAGAFAVPRIIFFPILLQVFGVGVNAQAAMASISAFFPIVVTTVAGVRDVSPLLVKLGRSMNLSRLQMVTKIFVPAAAPSLMTGMRIGFSISFITVIIAEFFAARSGLGLLTSRAYGQLNLPRMYAIVLLIVLIALAGNLTLWFIEKRLRSTTS